MTAVHFSASEVIFNVLVSITYIIKGRAVASKKAMLQCAVFHCDLLLRTDKQLHILGNLGFVNGKIDKSQKLKSYSQNLNSNTDMSSAATVHEMTFFYLFE